MYSAILKPLKKSNFLVTTSIVTVGLMVNYPAFSATHSTPQHRINERYAAQNVVNNTTSLEKIYISEEGTNLGWIIRIRNSVVAVDAGGSLIKILERAADNSSDNTVEYYTSGINEGKLMRIGNTYFQYYTSSGVLQEKIRSIGNLYFQYYNNGSVENGKIQSIGNIYFRYYNAGVNGVKVQSIGNVSFTYNNDGRMQRISGSQPGIGIQTRSIEQWRVLMGVISESPGEQLQPFPQFPTNRF
jgi:hypothetical protein